MKGGKSVNRIKCTDELFTLVRKQPEERLSKISIRGTYSTFSCMNTLD